MTIFRPSHEIIWLLNLTKNEWYLAFDEPKMTSQQLRCSLGWVKCKYYIKCWDIVVFGNRCFIQRDQDNESSLLIIWWSAGRLDLTKNAWHSVLHQTRTRSNRLRQRFRCSLGLISFSEECDCICVVFNTSTWFAPTRCPDDQQLHIFMISSN